MLPFACAALRVGIDMSERASWAKGSPGPVSSTACCICTDTKSDWIITCFVQARYGTDAAARPASMHTHIVTFAILAER